MNLQEYIQKAREKTEITEKEEEIIQKLFEVLTEKGYLNNIYTYYGLEIAFFKQVELGRKYSISFDLMKKEEWKKKWSLKWRVGETDNFIDFKELDFSEVMTAIKEIEKEQMEEIKKEEERRKREERNKQRFRDLMDFYGLETSENNNHYENMSAYKWVEGKNEFSIGIDARVDYEKIEIRRIVITGFRESTLNEITIKILDMLKPYLKNLEKEVEKDEKEN